MNTQARFRIKKGVRPYGGRTFPGVRAIRPNGRRVVIIYVDTTATAHKLQGLGGDPREYEEDEVEEVDQR